MAALPNQRHELFAQALAAGKTSDEAYQVAGFAANRGNATRLKANESVQQRVAELQARAADGVVLTKQWVIERLIENVERAMQVEKPEPGADYKYDGSVANRALELLGKEQGMFVDRAEVNQTTKVIADKPQSADEWEANYAGDADMGATGGASESTH